MSGQTGWKVDTNLTQVVKSNFSAVICAHLCWLAKKTRIQLRANLSLIKVNVGHRKPSQVHARSKKTSENMRLCLARIYKES